MKVAFLVYQWGGHVLHFVELTYEALKRCGDVTVVCPNTVYSNPLMKDFISQENITEIKIVDKPENQVYLDCALGEFDVVYSNWFDGWGHVMFKLWRWQLCRRKVARCCGTLIHLDFAYRENKLFRFKLFCFLMLRYIAPLVYSRLFCIDEIGYQLIFGESVQNNKVVRLLEDPVEAPPKISSGDLRKQLGWKSEDKIILAVGVIDSRKRYDLLCRAFLRLPPEKNWKLVIAGCLDNIQEFESLKASSKYGNQVIWENRWLTNEEMVNYISACDYMACCYDNPFHNASYLFRAMKANKPCLISNRGWMKYYGAVHHCGIPVDIYSSSDFDKSLKSIFLSNPDDFECLSEQSHSQSYFIETIVKELSSLKR